MSIRDMELGDLRIIEKFPREFPLPNLNHPTYALKKSIVIDDEVKGLVYAKITSEISLILDPDLGKISRVKILKEIFDLFLKELNKVGINDTHISVSEESFSKFLKHLGFKETGKEMYYG